MSCSECGRPICTDCVTFAPVGLRCPDHAASGGGRSQGVQQKAQRAVRRTTRVGPTDAIVTKILVAANVIVYLITVAMAVRLKARFPIAYADAFAAATAIRMNAVIVTGDPEFRRMEHLVTINWL